MGFLDKFLEPEERKLKVETEEGGERQALENTLPNNDTQVQISGKGAEEILHNALISLEDREVTIYTLQDLVSTVPPGTDKESILGILSVTKIPVEEIKKDAQERLTLLTNAESQLQHKVQNDVRSFEEQIKEAQLQIEENRKKKADAEELLRSFQLLKSKTADEIKNILLTIEA